MLFVSITILLNIPNLFSENGSRVVRKNVVYVILNLQIGAVLNIKPGERFIIRGLNFRQCALYACQTHTFITLNNSEE